MKKQVMVATLAAVCVGCTVTPDTTLETSDVAASDYPIRAVALRDAKVTGGFWLPRVETNRLVTLWTDFRRCEETGRIANFENAGKRARGSFQGWMFNDSDVFKVVEGASYILATHADPKLDAYLDALIAKIASAQEPDGYLYTARTLGFVNEQSGLVRWSNTPVGHELYNVGHLYEAAAAHFEATGKRTLLDVALKSADLVERTFGLGRNQLRLVPGHEEIEIGLCRLYRVTGDRRYLDLAKTFIDLRGRTDLRPEAGVADRQDHRPVLEQTEAVGHAVRAGYLYSGMADIAALGGDTAYRQAIDTLWKNVVGCKMHLTGGIGARRHITDPVYGEMHEAFGAAYDLPNGEAYLETCAAIANALWNQRLFLSHGDGKYVDVLERILYNGFLSGVSLSGDEFFYPNPLASKGDVKRSKWFGCSCCPVNVVRFIPQIVTFAYASREDEVYWNLFIESDATLRLDAGEVRLTQKTDYPWAGTAALTVTPPRDGAVFTLNVRIPGWATGRPVPSDLYTYTDDSAASDVHVTVNDKPVEGATEKGYLAVRRAWRTGDTVKIALTMPVRRVKAHAAVAADAGRLAVERGPILYCAEAVDNDGAVLSKRVAADAPFTLTTCDILGSVFPALNVPATDGNTATTLKLIPYFAWCHRAIGEMQVWLEKR